MSIGSTRPRLNSSTAGSARIASASDGGSVRSPPRPGHAEVEVGAQGAVEPDFDAPAEAVHHDSDPNGGGKRDHEGRDGDCAASKARRGAAHRDRGQYAAPAASEAPDEVDTDSGRPRGEEHTPEHEREECRKSGRGIPRRPGDEDSAAPQAKRAEAARQGQQTMCTGAHGGLQGGGARSHPGRLQGGHCRREQPRPHPEGKALQQSEEARMHVAHRDDEVVIVQGTRHEIQEALGEEHSPSPYPLPMPTRRAPGPPP